MPPVETRTCASLHPAVAEAARRAGGPARIGLVDLAGPTPGLNTHVDRVCVVLGDDLVLGDPASPVRVAGSIRGRVRPPVLDVPEVVARVALGRSSAAVDAPEPVLALLASDPVTVVERDPLAGLPEALALVPDDALPVVTTTWSLSAISVPDRLRFVHALDHAATRCTVAWVSLEGVGVAPAVPTFGDRHASGHTIVGVALLRHGRLDVEAVARCWSRGSVLGWVAEPPAHRVTVVSAVTR